MHIYEYLFTGIIIVVMLGASIAMVSVLSQPSQDAADKELLKVTTYKIMTQVLIDPGYPFNWGSDGNSPSGFGLAKYGITSREIYLLDPDKVQRLNPKVGSAYVEPKEVLNCLNLGNDYGFTLEITELLNVEVTKASVNQAVFNLTVTSATNYLPVKNANITAALYTLNGEKVENKASITANTGYAGNCTLDFKCTSSVYDVLILSVDYSGLHLTKVALIGADTLPAYIIGNTVETSQQYSLNEALTAATEVLVTEQHSAYVIDDYQAALSTGENSLVLEDTPEASSVAVLVAAKSSDGTPVLLVGYRDFDISYRSIPAIQSASFSYSMERKASISGTTCLVTLYLWRMAV